MYNPLRFASYTTKGYPLKTAKYGDVGHDLHVDLIGTDTSGNFLDRLVSEFTGTPSLVILPFQTKVIPSGIAVEMPDSIWCQIVARSSTVRKSLAVFSGIIDSGYRGQLFAVIHNFGLIPRIVRQGERYAQVIFFDAQRPLLDVVVKLGETERGATGFGSSGR